MTEQRWPIVPPETKMKGTMKSRTTTRADSEYIEACEARIRELEAELARRNSAVGGCDHSGVWCEFADFLWARAEKAEAEIESCPNKHWHQSVKLRGLVV